MTHNELLSKLDNLPKVIGLAEFKVRHDALIAVVELHKPRDYKAGNCCIGCNADYEYPCPTIQAIESELSRG
jgi:hypothetical protein